MQTQYQLLYRYVNETTNTAITDEYDYTETKEFYTPDHKLYFTTDQLRNFAWDTKKEKRKMDLQFWFDNKNDPDAADDKIYTSTIATDYVASITGEGESDREAIILNEMANANKSNNFYIYDGTTKEYHKTFVPEAIGYKVANPAGVPARQMPTGPDDYSKHFVMLGGSKPGIDGAFLVCKSEYISAYETAYSETNPKKEQIVLSGEKLANNLIFDWYNPQDDSYIPAYGETPATLSLVTSQSVDALYGGSRIINLDSEDYLITSAKEITCDVAVSRVWSSYVGGGDYAYFHESKYTGGTAEWNLQNWGTLFFNCGTVIPPQISFATTDNVTLLDASVVMPSEPSSKNGDDVVNAYIKYAQSIQGVISTPQASGSNINATTRRTESKSGPINPQSINYFTGWKVADLKAANMGNFIDTLTIAKTNLTRYSIPAHYEPSGKAPYLIKDNYKKIPLSPWILHSVHNSLESGLEKARALVSMIGIDNVKLIKTVPFDQFIKIK
jgi:hypothetical protein